MKAVVAAFNQEKALVGAFSVIVQLHRLIDLRRTNSYRVGGGLVGEAVVAGVAVLGAGYLQPQAEVLPGLVPHQLLPLHRRQQEGGVQPRLRHLGRGGGLRFGILPSPQPPHSALAPSHLIHEPQPPPAAPAARPALHTLPHLRLLAVHRHRRY